MAKTGMDYDGAYHQGISNFQRERYLEQGFTQGTEQEVEFLLELLNLPPNAWVLDVGCGPGRHSLELARRGFHPVGIDIAETFIGYANEIATKEKLPAEFREMDARALEFEGEFDAAVCLCEGAFGVAGDETAHRQILAGVSRALRPGARFVLTAINAFSATRNEDPAMSTDPYTATSSWTQTLENPQGETRAFKMSCTAFTYRELKWLLEGAGLEVEAGYGCVAGNFTREPLKLSDIEIMMVARKP